MTAQSGEILIYKGIEYVIASEPLEAFLSSRPDLNLVAPHTGCWRGYYGKWLIDGGKLFLIDLTGFLKLGITIGIDYLFPGEEFVMARWYTGIIRIPQGNLIHFAHGGYGSIYEKEIQLKFENGVLKEEVVVEFTEADIEKRRSLFNRLDATLDNLEDLPF